LEEAWHIRGLGNKLRMLYIAGTETLACATADRTVAVSNNTCRFYPWIKQVIPNGVDTTAFFPGKKEAGPTILFVGTYHNRKRGKWLMEVFDREVRPKVPDAKLWMVCTDAPPASGVEVLGRLTTEELTDRYRRAWVFCLPSTYEGFGVPYIEAMASGTAVVATINPGSAEVLDGGKYGALVDDEELGDAIVRVLTDAKERERLEQNGLARAARYSWDVVAAEYETLYCVASQLRDHTPRSA
jgi:glycosyltransferase involved in cell wall biosynthesis